MVRNHLLLCLFGISAWFLAGIVARKAIIGGGLVSHTGLVSYQVSVQIRDHGHVCGGGIIGDKFILTAAHCVLDLNRRLRSAHISVLAGTINLNRTSLPAVTRGVKQVFFPSEFHPKIRFSYGDIAILKLVDPLLLVYHPNLAKLQLPRYDHNTQLAFIAGFGWNQINRNAIGSTDGLLRDAGTSALSDEECERANPPGAIETQIHLCGRAQYYTVCNGDAGGPLVVYGDIVIGILSRIPFHCTPHKTEIYTRVIYYLPMILNVMNRGHDPHAISLFT